MKTLKHLFYFSFFLFHSYFLIGQNWAWGAQAYGSIKTNDFGSPVATDNSGNAYVAGQFSNGITFGAYTLTGNSDNAYLAKYNSSGTVQWAIGAVDSNNSYSFSTCLSTDLYGNIYMGGYFSGIIRFGSTILGSSSTANTGGFLIKFDPNGNVIWARQSNPVTSSVYIYSSAAVYSICTDRSGNILITGVFSDTVSFGGYTLYASNDYRSNVFLVKYDPSGNVLWAEQSSIHTPATLQAAVYSVAADNAGNSFITGYFIDSIRFGAYSLHSTYSEMTLFIAKYSPTGSLLWLKQGKNSSVSTYCQGTSVVADQDGNAYITGYFSGLVDIGSLNLYSPATTAAFLVKFDPSGNAVWCKETSPGWQGSSLAADNQGNIYMAGTIYNTEIDSFLYSDVHLNPQPWVMEASFIMKLDANGFSSCGSILNNLGKYYSTTPIVGIAVDASGTYIYTAGTFINDTIACGPDTLIAYSGGTNVFTGRWNGCNSADGMDELKDESEKVKVYPNPCTNYTTIILSAQHSLSDTHNLELDDITGRKLKQVEFTGNTYTLSAEGLAKGMYFVRVFDKYNNVIGTTKIVVQ